MNVELRLPEELVAAIADAVAERVGAAPLPGEPWRLLDVQETAAVLGRSTRWVRERVRRGDLVHVRLDGGALAFDPDDVREFARARRVGVPGSLAGPLAGGRRAA